MKRTTFTAVLILGVVIMLCFITFNVCTDYTNKRTARLEHKIDSLKYKCDSIINVLNDNIDKRDTIIININPQPIKIQLNPNLKSESMLIYK